MRHWCFAYNRSISDKAVLVGELAILTKLCQNAERISCYYVIHECNAPGIAASFRAYSALMDRSACKVSLDESNAIHENEAVNTL